jgi:hypothetical protein
MFDVMHSDGETYTYDAPSWDVVDGALVFYDDDENAVAAVACGQWIDVSTAGDDE